MLVNIDYYEETHEDNREFQNLEAEYTLSLCYAMICSQMGN